MEMEIHQMPPNQPHRHPHLQHHHYPSTQMYDPHQHQQQQPQYPHIVSTGQHSPHPSLLLNDLYPPPHLMLQQQQQQVKMEPLEMLGAGQNMDGQSTASPGHSMQQGGGSPSKTTLSSSPNDASPSHPMPLSSAGYDLLAPVGIFDSKSHLLPAEFQPHFDSATVAAAVELATSVAAAASAPTASTTKSTIRTHDRKRPYPCSHCSSKFGSKMELEEHTNSHSGLKPFQCDICQSRFNRRSTLWNHKRIHSDAKPFSCTVCHMTFKWKNSLKCHKEMHQRKNETIGQVDQDIKNLTYATAAKKQKAEKNGVEPMVAIHTLPSLAVQQSSKKKGGNKKASKKQQRELSLALAASGQIGSFPMDLLGRMDPLNGGQSGEEANRTSETSAEIPSAPPAAPPSFDFSNQLLMQAICNSNSAAAATQSTAQAAAAPSVRQLTADETVAMEFVSAQLGLDQQQSLRNQQQQQQQQPAVTAAAAMTSPIGNQQPVAVHQQQPPPAESTPTAATFLSQLDTFCHGTSANNADAQQSLRFPQFFDSVNMNVFDFQQFTERTNQQLVQPYNIAAAATSSCPTGLESIHASAIHQQSPMLSQHRTDMLDMQHLYQQSFDPSLLLNQSQPQPMDYVQFDYMLNGAPVYPQFAAQNMGGHPQMGLAAAAPPNAQFHSNASMEQLSQEELQNFAKMFPCDKWT